MKGPRLNLTAGLRFHQVGRLTLVVLLLLVGVVSAGGPSYWMGWWTVEGGGATLSSAGYVLSGTAGQPDAGTMRGGDYVFGGGFWGGGEDIPTACPVPLTGVTLAGPDMGQTNETLVFSATPQPSGATEPITYTWSGDGLISGQGTDQASYQWATAGEKTVLVIARNCGGRDIGDKRVVTISEQPPTCDRPITGVTINGPTEADVDSEVTLTAAVEPADATPPISYTWSGHGLVGGQATASATYRWSEAGAYQVIVSASNCGGSESDSHSVEVGVKLVFIPLVLR